MRTLGNALAGSVNSLVGRPSRETSTSIDCPLTMAAFGRIYSVAKVSAGTIELNVRAVKVKPDSAKQEGGETVVSAAKRGELSDSATIISPEKIYWYARNNILIVLPSGLFHSIVSSRDIKDRYECARFI